MAIRKKAGARRNIKKALRKFHKKNQIDMLSCFEADISEDEKATHFFRMPTICANVEMNSSVSWNEIWSSFCAQKDIVPCKNCMEKYRIRSMHWKRKKFYQMRKHKS